MSENTLYYVGDLLLYVPVHRVIVTRCPCRLSLIALTITFFCFGSGYKRSWQERHFVTLTPSNVKLHVAFTETFQCPVCHAIGQNAETECDENVKYEVCNRNDAGCQLTKTIADDNRLEVKRKCSDKQTFNKEKEECGQKKTCVNTAFCTQSRCMATSPGTGFNEEMF